MHEKQRLDAAFLKRGTTACPLSTVTDNKLCGDAGHNIDLTTDNAFIIIIFNFIYLYVLAGVYFV
jgi:hypothetical protein